MASSGARLLVEFLGELSGAHLLSELFVELLSARLFSELVDELLRATLFASLIKSFAARLLASSWGALRCASSLRALMSGLCLHRLVASSWPILDGLTASSVSGLSPRERSMSCLCLHRLVAGWRAHGVSVLRSVSRLFL